MDGNTTDVRIQHARVLAQDLWRVDTLIERERTRLMDALKARGVTWVGEAKVAYHQVEVQWAQQMLRMDANLRTAAGALEYSADAFDRAEKYNTGLFSV